MVDVLYPANAVAGAPAYSGRMLRQTGAPAFAGATAARPLGARSGVRPGTSVTTVTASSTTWSCGAFAGVADVQAAAESGPYQFAFDAAASGSLVAASASGARTDIVYVQVDDPSEADGSSVPLVSRKYLAGVAGGGTPALPVSRAFVIALINVPISGGGSPSVSWVAPYAVAAGGIIPFATLAQLNATTANKGDVAQVIGDTVANNGSYVCVGGTVWIARSPVFGSGTLSTVTSEAVAPGCSLTLGVGAWDVVASAYADWNTSGGTTPVWTYRIRSGGLGGVEQDNKAISTGVHLGKIPVMLQAVIVVTSPTTIVLTGMVTGPAAGTTISQSCKIRATPAI